jgi:MYXO-CTERM domain-containing protein
MTPQSITLALAATALGLALSAAAHAGNVQASASQNPSPADHDSNGGATASAVWAPGASASSTRFAQSYWTDGTTGSSATTAFGASGAASSQYDLWDLAADRALTQLEADTIDLAFNFSAEGLMSVDMDSLSVASVGHSLALYSTGFEQSGSNSTTVYGPTGYLHTGDGWTGAFAFGFTLMHRSDANGQLDMFIQGSAAHQSRSWATLALNSVTLAAGAAPVGGLGIRLRETGEIMLISSPVPEPATWALWLTGLGLAGAWRRLSRPAV